MYLYKCAFIQDKIIQIILKSLLYVFIKYNWLIYLSLLNIFIKNNSLTVFFPSSFMYTKYSILQ